MMNIVKINYFLENIAIRVVLQYMKIVLLAIKMENVLHVKIITLLEINAINNAQIALMENVI
jgi:hypothetical protein